MPRLDADREQAEGGNDRQVDSVLHRDEACFRPGRQLRHGWPVARIDFDHRQIFVDQLRLEIPQPGKLVRHRVIVLARHHDTRHFLSAKRNTMDGQFFSGPPRVGKWIKRKLHRTAPSLALPGQELDQLPRHRNFMHTVLGQAHPDGVPDAIGQKRPDAHGTLDPSILAVTRLGHTKMDRIIPIWSFDRQARGKKAVSGDHDLRIRGLHGENKVMVTLLPGEPGKLQRTFHHAERRVAVAVHDPVAQRTVIRADAHGDAARPAQLDQGREFFPDTPDLGRILFVAVFAHRKFFRVRIVARVDPHLVHPLGRLERRVGLKMNVGHQRNMAAAGLQSAADRFQIPCVLDRRRRDAHDFAAYVSQLHRLADTGQRIHRVAGDHGLHAHRVVSPDAYLADIHRAAAPAFRIKWKRQFAAHRTHWSAGTPTLHPRSGAVPGA